MKINLKLPLAFCSAMMLIGCMREPDLIGDAVAIENYRSLSVIKGFPGEKTTIDSIKAKEILIGLKELSTVQGPIKYIKTYRFVIEHKSGANDTLFTNGTIFRLNNEYYKSTENLIKKFGIK